MIYQLIQFRRPIQGPDKNWPRSNNKRKIARERVNNMIPPFIPRN